MKTREVKGKGKNERYTHLNAEFQKNSKERQETFLRDQCKEIKKNINTVKSKGEKERYKHLTAEFQRIARRDKKAFLSNQCKEIEENNRMGSLQEIFSRKLEIPREHFMKDGLNKGQK